MLIFEKPSVSGKSASNELQHRIIVIAGIKFFSIPVEQYEIQHTSRFEMVG